MNCSRMAKVLLAFSLLEVIAILVGCPVRAGRPIRFSGSVPLAAAITDHAAIASDVDEKRRIEATHAR